MQSFNFRLQFVDNEHWFSFMFYTPTKDGYVVWGQYEDGPDDADPLPPLLVGYTVDNAFITEENISGSFIISNVEFGDAGKPVVTLKRLGE